TGRFLHHVILDSCRRSPQKTAIIDSSCGRRLTYGEYGDIVENLARGFVTLGVKAGDVIAIFLANSWEFCAAYHAATLAGAVPTLLNPTYREREVRYQLENSGAVLLITDAPFLRDVNLVRFGLVANVCQFVWPHCSSFAPDDVMLCFLPLYHVYGLSVLLSPALILCATLLLMPGFNMPQLLGLLVSEGVSTMPT